MFENISSTMNQCFVFFIAGIVMGLFYEALRFSRMLIRHNAVAVCIEDAVYLSLTAVIGFIIALSVGIGYFRIYYIVCEAIGAILYFLTLGRLINYALRHFSNAVKHILRVFFDKIIQFSRKYIVPIAKKVSPLFSKFAEIAENVKKYRKKGLKSEHSMMYNKKEKSDGGGENRSVVQAKIRK